jgi:DNA uptake protein ComE-like DNA-binding protein
MSTGDRQRASDWLPPDLDAANAAEPDTVREPDDETARPGGADDGANGAREAEETLERFNESAERAKKALQASQGRGEKVDEQVRAAAAGKAMQAVRDAEATAREAAEVAERMAEKVAALSERLANRDRELAQLHEQAAEQEASHERELAQLREEIEQQAAAEPEPVTEPEPEPKADAEREPEPTVRHQPREPAHRRQQTEPATLDLNVVGFDELCSFGLSVKQAARLIGYREQSGGFESPSDLDRLSGMPEKTIEALKNAAGG